MNDRNSLTIFLPVAGATADASAITVTPDVALVINSSELIAIQECMKTTKETIKLTSAFPGSEHNAKAVEIARQDMNSNIFNRLSSGNFDISESLLLRMLANAIKSLQAGNCHEFAIYCHWLLKSKGIQSEIFKLAGGNHVFLIVNRDQKTSASDFRTWNKEAIVVDPYLQRIYTGSEIPNFLQSMSYDDASHTVRYIPYNSASHVLDNSELANIVAEWKSVLATQTQTKKVA